MKIVIAPDSFKESLTAMQVATAIEEGFREVFPEARVEKAPVADGGEGTVQTLVDALGGEFREITATRPNGGGGPAAYGLIAEQGLAVIEMAAASGLEVTPPSERNPLTATSRGTGELMLDALAQGAQRLLIGIGGSATNDGGAGMLQALGVRLLDAEGRELPPGGAALARLARIDVAEIDPRLRDSQIEVACDVTNPLTGPRGASAVFGPQKGATPEMVEELDKALARFAEILARDLGQEVADVPGAGAAGGLGAALMAVCGARLRPGCEVVLDAIALEDRLAGADLVITGEGRTDGQTVGGKAPIGVAGLAGRHGVPVIVISGSLTDDASAVLDHGVAALFSAVPRPCDLETALRDGADNLRRIGRNVAATLQLGMRLSG